jgi:aspartyl-tRNA synthetase
VILGWVARRRDLGNLLFLDVRDRTAESSGGFQ